MKDWLSIPLYSTAPPVPQKRTQPALAGKQKGLLYIRETIINSHLSWQDTFLPLFVSPRLWNNGKSMLSTIPPSRGIRRQVYITPPGVKLSRPLLSFLRKRQFGRKGLWLTQKDLAELLGLSVQEIGRLERGERRPSFEGLFLLAAILRQPPHLLYPELWQKASEVIEARRRELGIGDRHI